LILAEAYSCAEACGPIIEIATSMASAKRLFIIINPILYNLYNLRRSQHPVFRLGKSDAIGGRIGTYSASLVPPSSVVHSLRREMIKKIIEWP
jgi:hypothetical protein